MNIIGFIVGIGVVCLIAAALVNYLTRSEELQYGTPFFFRGYSRDRNSSDDTYCALYVDCAAGFTYVVNPSQVDIVYERCANGGYQFRIPRSGESFPAKKTDILPLKTGRECYGIRYKARKTLLAASKERTALYIYTIGCPIDCLVDVIDIMADSAMRNPSIGIPERYKESSEEAQKRTFVVDSIDDRLARLSLQEIDSTSTENGSIFVLHNTAMSTKCRKGSRVELCRGKWSVA